MDRGCTPAFVSIIIPCYNQGQLLRDAIDSALGQTYPHVEVIVVDDGSTDDTREVAASYGDRVRYLYQPNAGLSAARNTGIAAARGEYVNFLDSDDTLLPQKIERQVSLLERDPSLGLVYCGHYSRDETGRVRQGELCEVEYHDAYHSVRRGYHMPVHAALVRRACLEEAGTFDTRLRSLEDWDLWLRIALRWRFDFSPEPLVEYRDLSESMSKDLYRMTTSHLQVLELHSRDHADCPECSAADEHIREWLQLGRAPELYRGAFHRMARGRWREGAAWLRLAARLYPSYLIDPKRLLRAVRIAPRISPRPAADEP